VKHWEEIGQAGFLVDSYSRLANLKVMKYAFVRMEGQEDIKVSIRSEEDVER
jgi:hypothetical protein